MPWILCWLQISLSWCTVRRCQDNHPPPWRDRDTLPRLLCARDCHNGFVSFILHRPAYCWGGKSILCSQSPRTLLYSKDQKPMPFYFWGLCAVRDNTGCVATLQGSGLVKGKWKVKSSVDEEQWVFRKLSRFLEGWKHSFINHFCAAEHSKGWMKSAAITEAVNPC